VLKSLPPNDDSEAAPEDDDAKKIDAMTGLNDCAATSGARSLDGEQVAVVCTGRDGTQRLRVGQFGKDVREVAGLQGKTLTRPTFPPGSTNNRVGYEVWTVADGRNVVRVHRNGDIWQPTGVDASQLFNSKLVGRGGKISTFRLSRDGVRAAIVVEGKLIVCTVLRTGDQVQLVSPTVITNGLENVHDVDWTSQTQMAVIFDQDNDGNADNIATVSVDGLYSTPMPTTNMSPPLTNIAAAPGQPFIAVSDKSTFTSVSSGSSWIPLGNLGQDAVPFYAG
jgi:hypothetical protein